MEEPRRRLNLLWEISSSTLAIARDDQRTLKERKENERKRWEEKGHPGNRQIFSGVRWGRGVGVSGVKP
jgi:hypothetical protein